MPKGKIREIAAKYGYFKLRKYRQWDDIHFSAETNGTIILVNIATGELFERNAFTQKLIKK